MFLIAGLGNPGRKYDGTRHNMGFDAIDYLVDEYRIPSYGVSMKAMYGKGRISGQSAILLKPMTYMNLSGQAVGSFVRYYKVNPETELIVIYDDIDQEPGMIRVRKRGSAGGHNGMKSVISEVGTDRFARIRIGIGAKPQGWDLADYVLGHFDTEERRLVDGAVRDAADAVKMIVEGDIDGAMNRYNRHKEVKEI